HAMWWSAAKVQQQRAMRRCGVILASSVGAARVTKLYSRTIGCRRASPAHVLTWRDRKHKERKAARRVARSAHRAFTRRHQRACGRVLHLIKCAVSAGSVRYQRSRNVR
ncbi:MAG: hypothetical protein MI757_21205, partial [Pirellulales bacterium]|nr:hypothetical protein [Pirellulales bacterium]